MKAKGIWELLSVTIAIFLATEAFGYSAPTKNAHFFGDANGDLSITPVDITQHKNFMNGKTCSYNTLQPSTPAQRWNTCDLNHDKLCTFADITQMQNYLLGKSVTLGDDDPWGIVSTLTSPQEGWHVVNFQLGLYATVGGARVGIPGISIEAKIDNANSTVTGYLTGRSCDGGIGDVPAPVGAQCAIGVTITQWNQDANYGWTELSPLPLGIYADGNGVIELDFEVAQNTSLDIPQVTYSQQIIFSGGNHIVLDCPSYVHETDPISCPVITIIGPSPCLIGPNDTCGGSIDPACTGPYTAPPQGEGVAPSVCTAEVVKGASSEVHYISIWGENHPPYFTSVPPTTAKVAQPFTYQPTYTDDDVPNNNPGEPGYVSCAVSNNTCSWLTFTGCNAYGIPTSEGNCSYHLTVTDGLGATAEQAVNLTIIFSTTPKISAGYFHTCALTQSGGVKCWGNNLRGQLGDGTTTDKITPVDVVGLSSGVIAISAGDYHTCALTQSGGVKCWGDNYYGQVGDGTTTDKTTPVDVSGLTSGVIAISAGGYHTCALTQSGGLKCWGQNNTGQLGDGTTTYKTTPVDVSELSSGAMGISAGGEHSCAITENGGVKCWGSNYYGQLGFGNWDDSFVPVNSAGLTAGVIAVAAGDGHGCAITETEGVKCWGRNGDGQLGNGTVGNSSTPVNVEGFSSGASAISAGCFHTCGITESGMVKCWGDNYYGQLGNGTTTDSLIPVDVEGLSSPVIAISAGCFHTCALTSSGGAMCWGRNEYGQVGDGTTTTRRITPVYVTGLAANVIAISAGYYHSCAIKNTGEVKCWGYNYYGQVGDGTTTNRATPRTVSGLTSGVSAISGGGTHTCALTSTGGVKCWGNNQYGQVGDGTQINRITPVAVSGLTSGVSGISGGGTHTCALTSTGGVKCWGNNKYGQLGDRTYTNKSTPADVFGLTAGITAISAGGYHTYALTNTNGIKGWGYNQEGALGYDGIPYQTTPVDVVGLTLW